MKLLPGIAAFVLPFLAADLLAAPDPCEIHREFIYNAAPYPSCHASTLAETPGGLVASWFGGTHEKHPDVGIWFSRLQGGAWTTPVEVADGVESTSVRYPTWNPVLLRRGVPCHSHYRAAFAFSATTANEAGSANAISARTFRSSLMLASERPLISLL